MGHTEKQEDDQVWLVSFLGYDIGFIDNDENRVKSATNPFASEKCKPSLRNKLLPMSPALWRRDSPPKPTYMLLFVQS